MSDPTPPLFAALDQQFPLSPDAKARDIGAHLDASGAFLNLVTRNDPRTRHLLSTFEGLVPAALQLAAFNDDFAASAAGGIGRRCSAPSTRRLRTSRPRSRTARRSRRSWRS